MPNPVFSNYHTQALFEYICSQRDLYFKVEEEVDLSSTLREFSMWMAEFVNELFNGATAKCFVESNTEYFLIERNIVKIDELAYTFLEMAYDF